MAAVEKPAEMTIQKNSQILVNVEEALTDLLVVSYITQNKKFQGVLLDSNKGNLPFGVYSLHPAFTKGSSASEDKNRLHSVSQRYSYEETENSHEKTQLPKKPGPKGKQKSQKMTVRLRPRKVLCSNCQGICNENSENVDVSKKRKLDSDDNTPETYESSQSPKKYLMRGMLIPKISRLDPSEISNATKGTSKPVKASEKTAKSDKSSDDELQMQHEVAFVSVSDDVCDRQDLKDNDVSFNSMFSSARTLKICFGEGEGTVVKIPPISGDFNEDSGVSCDMLKPSKPESKAAKKALKKAKKQAKKNNNSVSSTKSLIGPSPKHGGALSPRNNIDDQPLIDPLEKKHRHKVKHKKKHRIPKKRDENTSKSNEDTIEYFGDIKEHCLKQKLSINLRRLSSDSYEHGNVDDLNDSDSEEWDGEVVPDFPAVGTEGAGGRLIRVSPGDVVWGKVYGFPWWPGRVLSVKSPSRAHVAWFASTTSSLMPCDSLCPFLEDYKTRFNKKKRGSYKEAVKLATIEAKRHESQVLDPLGSPTHTNITTTPPHPIDVFS